MISCPRRPQPLYFVKVRTNIRLVFGHRSWLLCLIFLALSGCSKRGSVSELRIAQLERKSGITSAEAYTLVEESGVFQSRRKPYKYPIIIGKEFFFPLRIPKGGYVTERGYYLDPFSKEARFVDRPKSISLKK